MRSALFWDVTHRRMALRYGNFGKCLSGSWKMGPIGCPETSVTNYHSTINDWSWPLKIRPTICLETSVTNYHSTIKDLSWPLKIRPRICPETSVTNYHSTINDWSWPLKIRPTICPETSVTNYHSTINDWSWPLKIRPTICSETPVAKYRSMLRKIPDERRSLLRRNFIKLISESLQQTPNSALTQLRNTPEGTTSTGHLKFRRREYHVWIHTHS